MKQWQTLTMAAALTFAQPAPAQTHEHDEHNHDHAHHHHGENGKNPLIAQININLLGKNGEITVAFLDGLGVPGCKAKPSVVKKNPRSTDKKDLEAVYTHLLLHGRKAEQISEACREAQEQWREKQIQRAPAP